MSRGDRVAVSGILSNSMRSNYNEHGVDEYYKKVGSTYRNPHYPGIRTCLFSWLNKWWEMELENVSSGPEDQILVFDMACGTGEATLAFLEWWKTGKRLYTESLAPNKEPKLSANLPLPRRKTILSPPSLGPESPSPRVIAADPYTSTAYHERTRLPCSALSFKDVAEGSLPQDIYDLARGPQEPMSRTSAEYLEAAAHQPNPADMSLSSPHIEMVICSFAMHLIENPSELFSLLWELSTKARWLVILAPHKKPELKEGWGWSKWNTDTWQECLMTEHAGELLNDRVHCRIYRSVNCVEGMQ
ncbi:hypothetical protein BDQ12DRAFT_679873 [Crucibulum laeve]|uniref:Methyltransferase domain-containing protein n=1 Tax=Crucibulum laeve TaxID=68775 RepID=A0A5C3M5J9_9AGAR|nr:hypothetical protein BDQ12DRAFT_679873 [Crucibulum laeve]